jgi:hypothetical protein
MGGGNPASSEVTTDLPDWAKPYYERALGRVEASSLTPYQQYSGDRLANAADYGNITKAQGIVSNLGGVQGLGAAQDYSKYAMDQSKALGNYTPTQTTAAQFSPYAGYKAGSAAPYSGFQAGAANPYNQFQQSQFSEYNYDPSRQFSGQEVQNYMNPYMQNVVDQQSKSAITNFNRQNASRAAQGVQAGAFGGSRQGVVQGMAEEGLMGQLDQIQGKGLSDAYGQAQGAFQADRSAQVANEQARAAEASRVQTESKALGNYTPTQTTAAQFSPYAGYKAGSAAPYSGFQAGAANPYNQFQQSQFSEYNYDPSRQFSGQEVQNYMNPYMQNVVDQQSKSAITNFNRQNASRAAQGRSGWRVRWFTSRRCTRYGRRRPHGAAGSNSRQGSI